MAEMIDKKVRTVSKRDAIKEAKAELEKRGVVEPDMKSTTKGSTPKVKEVKPPSFSVEMLNAINKGITDRLNVPKAALVRTDDKQGIRFAVLQCNCGEVASYPLAKMAHDGYIKCRNCKKQIAYGTYEIS